MENRVFSQSIIDHIQKKMLVYEAPVLYKIAKPVMLVCD